MTGRNDQFWPLALLCVASLQCTPSSSDNDQPKNHEGIKEPELKKQDTVQHVVLTTRVRLPDSVVRAARIGTALVAMDVLPVTIDLTGEIAFDPDRAAQVTARVPGRIVDVYFKEGEALKHGVPLVSIESPSLAQARASYKSAMSKAELAQQNAQRITALSEKGLASGQELSLALAESKNAQADVNASFQTLAAYGPAAHQQTDSGSMLTIYAPIDGTILSRNATRGQTVVADSLLATLADFAQAYFLARLFEKDMALTTVGSDVEIRLNAYPSMVFSGVVESVGRQIDPVARTAVARILVKDRNDTLKAGLFGTARLSVGVGDDRARTLVVPITAVTQLGDRKVVFVHEADGYFEVHPVTTGQSASGKVQVLSGLNPNEAVVVDGVFALKSAVLKSTFGEEE